MAKVTGVAECSGIDGTWGLRAENLDIAREVAVKMRDAIVKADGEVVAGGIENGSIDEVVEVGVLHAQLDQLARQGVEVVVHRRLGLATSSRFWVLLAGAKRL